MILIVTAYFNEYIPNIPCPSYSPNLAPCTSSSFLTENWSERKLESETLEGELSRLWKEDIQAFFQKRQNCWSQAIQLQGNYSEMDKF